MISQRRLICFVSSASSSKGGPRSKENGPDVSLDSAISASRFSLDRLPLRTSEERHAGQFCELGREFILKAGIRHVPGRNLRSTMMPVAAADDSSGIIADRKPGLGEISHLKIVWRSRAAHFRLDPARIDGVAQNIRPPPGDGVGERCDVQLAL